MKRTKIILTALLLAALVVLPVSAHGMRRQAVNPQEPTCGVSVCPFEDCREAGRHYHDGVCYCGYNHEGGLCDGSCQSECPYNGECPNNGVCPNNGECPNNGVCPNNGECPNNFERPYYNNGGHHGGGRHGHCNR